LAFGASYLDLDDWFLNYVSLHLFVSFAHFEFLSPKKNPYLLAQQSSASWVPTNKLGQNSEKELLNNDLLTEFVKWREILADRNQWRSICGS
jgi:hypothetical protein